MIRIYLEAAAGVAFVFALLNVAFFIAHLVGLL